MEFLMIRHEDDCWFTSDVQGNQMKALDGVLDADGVEELFGMMKKYILDFGATGTGGNLTSVDIENGIATMRLSPSVFGNVEPFQTDEKQFKYMVKEFNRLMEKKVPTIMITRDDNGTIAVYEPNVAL